MTPEELTRLVIGGDAQKLIDAMAPLDEPQRKKLAKIAANLARAAKDQESDAWRRVLAERGAASSEEFGIKNAARIKEISEMAVLGLCAWTQARRALPHHWTLVKIEDNPIYRILSARRPEWIDQWVQQQIDARFSNWPLIRRPIRDGICTKPANDAYVILMFRSHLGWWTDKNAALAEHLRRDPDLLNDEIWRIFEIDLSREIVLGDSDDARFSWRIALATLAESGEIDRQRLLDCSLSALNRQVHATNASWFCALHETLKPTPQDRARHQPQYIDLLSSSVSTVVSFAIAALKTLAQAGKLKAEAVAAAIGPVFDIRHKAHPVMAVQLLKMAAKSSPQIAPTIAVESTRGLSHASPDVQKACLALIESLATGPDSALSEAIAQRLDSVAASLRSRVQAMLAKVGAAEAAATATSTNEKSPLAELPTDAEIATIPQHWRDRAGVDACLAVFGNGTELPRLDFNPMSVPRLDPAAALKPIATLDELIERSSTAVEELSDADEFELLLDGLSRLADRRPIDFEPRTAPLLKRIGDLHKKDPWSVKLLEPKARFRVLVQSWIQNHPLDSLPASNDRSSPMEFISGRMQKLSQRLISGNAGPLLACPTHRGGWIDSREFVRRMMHWQETARPTAEASAFMATHNVTDKFDLMAALLRLAPDHRAVALADAKDLRGESGTAVRFALGGDGPIGRHAGLWIAACRAREALGNFPALADMHGQLGPDAAILASRTWEIFAPLSRHQSIRVEIKVTPTWSSPLCLNDRPLVMLNGNTRSFFGMSTIANIRCRQSIWPANPDATFADGAVQICTRRDSPASTFSPTAPYLEPLFDPDTRFSDMAQLAVTLSLVSKDAGTRGLAIDALVALAADGRCTGEEVGALFARLCATTECVRLNRLAKSLEDVARTSPLHQHVASRLLQALLADLKAPAPDDLHEILTPLREWLTLSGEPVLPNCRTFLKSVTGAGKTAKLAAALLEARSLNSHHRQSVVAGAIRGRVDRAKRWSARDSNVR